MVVTIVLRKKVFVGSYGGINRERGARFLGG
jgi:hypothetical protein